jgi:hypothetical protein
VPLAGMMMMRKLGCSNRSKNKPMSSDYRKSERNRRVMNGNEVVILEVCYSLLKYEKVDEMNPEKI